MTSPQTISSLNVSVPVPTGTGSTYAFLAVPVITVGAVRSTFALRFHVNTSGSATVVNTDVDVALFFFAGGAPSGFVLPADASAVATWTGTASDLTQTPAVKANYTLLRGFSQAVRLDTIVTVPGSLGGANTVKGQADFTVSVDVPVDSYPQSASSRQTVCVVGVASALVNSTTGATVLLDMSATNG
jgi:hypothetical protein